VSVRSLRQTYKSLDQDSKKSWL